MWFIRPKTPTAFATVVGFALLAGACGGSSVQKAGVAPEFPAVTEKQFDEIPINWDNPIDGIQVAYLASAAAGLPFSVKQPTSIGQPIKILVAQVPEEAPPDFLVLAMMYETAEFGNVWVLEHHPSLPPDEYLKYQQNMASLSGTPVMHGTAELVKTRSGANALVQTSPDGSWSSITWYVQDEAGDIEVRIMGQNLTAGQAVTIANEFE
jgi:hypothetical protein